MSPPQLNPLTSEHLQCCNRVIHDTPQALELAQACIECGFPAQEIHDQLAAQAKQAEQIKARFFTTSS